MREFTVADVIVVPDRNVVVRGGTERHIEPRVMDLLTYLAQYPGEVIAREQLIAEVWPHTFVTDGALQTAVSSLRKAMGDDPRRPTILETIPKRGYRLIAQSTASNPVMVMPFRHLSGHGEQEYIADGVTEALIAELGSNSALMVISRQSVMPFKRDGVEDSASLSAVASELHARFVVHGLVTETDARLTVAVQLLDMASGTTLLNQKFSDGLENLLYLTQIISEALTAQLPIESETSTRVRRRNAGSTAAMVDYLRGKSHWYKLAPIHLERALDYLQSALAKDPQLAMAHAAVADVWGALGYWGFLPAHEVRPKVAAALENAAAADPNNAELHMISGAFEFYFHRDYDAAEQRLRRAIGMKPSLAHARMQHALLLATRGDAGALDEVDRAIRLDPLNPVVLLCRSWCLAGSGDNVEAQSEINRILAFAPDFPPVLEIRADLAWRAGSERATEFERNVWHDNEKLARLFAACDRDHPREALRAGAAMLLQLNASTYVAPISIARLLSLAGETEQALFTLERARQQDDLMRIDYLQLSPAFVRVREDPRYSALL